MPRIQRIWYTNTYVCPNGVLCSSINCIFVALQNKSIGIIGSILFDTWPNVCYLSIALLSYRVVICCCCCMYIVQCTRNGYWNYIQYKYEVNEQTTRIRCKPDRTPISCYSFAHFQRRKKKRIITSESSVHNFALSYVNMVYHTHTRRKSCDFMNF